MATASRLENFLQLVQSATNEELNWMQNHLSGLLNKKAGGVEAPISQKITITYGTETGNSKRLALDFATKARKKGIAAKLVSLDQYKLNDLPKEEYFLTVVSTHGDGEPPEAARKFYDHIHANGFTVPQMKYAVLALGDTSYPLFCKTGEDIDEQLQKLGASRVVPLQKCDLDYEEAASEWFENLLRSLDGAGPAIVSTPPVPAPKKTTGKKTYEGTVLTNINLNGRGSNKKTHHIEIAAAGLEYLPGDALGVVPENPVEAVENIIRLSGMDKDSTVQWRKETYTLFELLHKKVNVHFLQEKAVKQYAQLYGEEIPEGRLDLLDLLKKFPLKKEIAFESVIALLNPVPPRLYTISSSPAAHPGEIHVTVVKDRFRAGDEIKYGLCSSYLEHLPVGTSFNFFIQPNKRFRLAPAGKDIIMIGPGTGIAPFRSFIAERDALGTAGRSWLFFGEQYFTTDFLYQTEWQQWFSTGSLTKINLAFSRDQDEKIYVQHKMIQHGAELYQWISSGAYIYICGKKDPMSADVEQALVQIIETHGGLPGEAAVAFLEELKEAGRYEKDVY